MSITDQAILMKCTISQWNATIRDKKALKDFLTQEKMADDAGTLEKHLIAKTSLKSISDAAKNIRDMHRKMTMPWDLDGVGLLMNDKIFAYTKAMRELTSAFDEATTNFLKHYDVYISDSKLRLGNRFSADEFPNIGELQYRFNVSIRPLPIPQSGHILADLSESGIDTAVIDKAVKEAENKALQRLWQQVYLRLKYLKERLSDPESRFKSTTIEKLDDFIDKLEDFNIYESEELRSFVGFIRVHITNQDPREIRQFPETRNALLKHLDDALIACKPFIGDVRDGRYIEEDEDELRLAA